MELESQIAESWNVPPEQCAVFAELGRQIKSKTDVALLAEPNGDDWRLFIVAADKPGIVSIINGLLTSMRIDILNGDVYVFRPETSRSSRRSLFDMSRFRPHPLRRAEKSGTRSLSLSVLQVRPAAGIDDEFWSNFENRLREAVRLFATQDLAAARETFIEYAVRASSDYRRSLSDDDSKPIELKTRPSVDAKPAKLWVRGADSRGILFELTSALAMLNVSIQRLRIRTQDGQVRDTVWITDARGRHFDDEARLHELRESVTLILQFMRLLARTPDPEQALEQFVQLTDDLVSRRDGGAPIHRLESEQVLRTLAQVLGSSRFLWDDFLRMQHENLFPVVLDLPIEKRRRKADLVAELAAKLDEADEAGSVDALNRWKDRELFRIDLRHLMRKVDFTSFADELSDLAEATIDQACRLSHRQLQRRFGMPRLTNESKNRECEWAACGLGKLGGRELGYASDIEVLFVYQGDGKTDGPEPIANSDYHERFVAEFLRTVQAKRDGIFEVDLRLRPYGSAGSNAASLESFQKYFRTDGDAEQFQRLALVKLQPIAGSKGLARKITQTRDEYVYSDEPIDYGDIERLRRMQRTQLVPKGQISAKHSAGGLVDLEYFVQTQQIEVGRTLPRVRVPSTRLAIKRLAGAGRLPWALAQDLLEIYGFLRRLIDALRVVRGHAKDLTLPPGDSRAFAYLARRLQYDYSELLELQIKAKMGFLSNIWKFVQRN